MWWQKPSCAIWPQPLIKWLVPLVGCQSFRFTKIHFLVPTALPAKRWTFRLATPWTCSCVMLTWMWINWWISLRLPILMCCHKSCLTSQLYPRPSCLKTAKTLPRPTMCWKSVTVNIFVDNLKSLLLVRQPKAFCIASVTTMETWPLPTLLTIYRRLWMNIWKEAHTVWALTIWLPTRKPPLTLSR